MKKRLVVLALVALLVFSGMGMTENFNETGLPIVNEPTTIHLIGVRDAGFEDGFANVPSVMRWQEETGITINWETYLPEAWSTQKNMIIASLDLPDGFAGGNPLADNNDLVSWSEDGILMPLRELSEKYMPRFWEIMGEYPNYLKSFVDPEGEFYAFPTHFDIDFGNRGDLLYFSKGVMEAVRPELSYVQHEYFDEVDSTFTPEEFYDLLVDIKASTSAIPLSVNGLGGLNFIYWALGANENSNYMYIDDGVIKTQIGTPEWVEATKYINNLYKEQLLDQEVATQAYDTWRGKLMEEGRIGVTNMWSGLIAVSDYTDMSDPRYLDWAGVAPLVGKDGKQVYLKGSSGVAVKGSFAITTTCEVPEILARFQDYLYDEDNSYQLSYGDYGSGLIKRDDGRIDQNFEDSGMSGKFLNSMFITTSEMNSLINYAPATAMAIEGGATLAKPYHLDCQFPSMTITGEKAARIAEIKTDLDTYYSRMKAQFIVDGGVEEGVEGMMAELEKIGLNEYLEIYQELLDIYNSL